MKSDKVKIIAYPHPLKAERKIFETERKSFEDLFKEINSPLPIDNIIIFDGDRKIKDYSELPKTDQIYMKCIPAGDTANERGGNLSKGIGAALVVIGAITAEIPFLGSFLVATGVGLILGGVGLYWLGDLLPSDGLKVQQGASIRGSKNKDNKGGPIPILIGKHLIYPFISCSPYTVEVAAANHTYRPSAPDTQDIFQLFCAGYKDMQVDTATYKVGDTLLSDLDNFEVQLIQDGAEPTLYGERRYEVNVNKEVIATSIDQTETLILTSPTNVYDIEFRWVAQAGIADYDEEDEEAIEQLGVRPGVHITDENDVIVYSNLYYHLVGSRYTHRWSNQVTNTQLGSGAGTNRQYTIKVYRKNVPDKRSRKKDNFHLGSVVFKTADFSNPGDPNLRPINADFQDELTIIATKFRTSGIVQGVIDEFNFIAQTTTYVYSGSGSGAAQWTTVSATSNPAALFLYILRNQRVNKRVTENSQIDWESFEAWYTFCEDKEFEANLYITNDIKISEILDRIATLGRATWSMVDGKFLIIIDKERDDIIQYFTPRNSRDFEGEKSFSDVPNCLKLKHVNPDLGYVPTEIYVYDDNSSGFPDPSDTVQEIEISGAVNSDQATRMGKYILAQNKLQPEVYKFTADLEYVFCTRGDRIKINHDVPLFGLGYGRINSFTMSGGEVAGFISDEILRYEYGKNYGVIIRRQNSDTSSVHQIDVINPTTSTNTPIDSQDVNFVTNVSDTSLYTVSDLFMYGEREEETLDLIVTQIDPIENLSATITCFEYNEDIYAADEGTIPDYNPMISLPGSFSPGINIGPIINEEDYIAEINDSVAFNTLNSRRAAAALTGKRPNAYAVTDVSGGRSSFIDDENFVYVNLEDQNRLYVKKIGETGSGTKITNIAADYPIVLTTGKLIYINQEDDSKLYLKNDTTTVETGTAITTNSVWGITIDGDDNIFYVNYNDQNKIYKTTESDGDGTKLADISASNLSHDNGIQLLYVKLEDGKVYSKDESDNTAGDVIFDGPTYLIGKYTPSEYLYTNGSDNLLFTNSLTPAVGETDNIGTAQFAEVSTFSSLTESIIFSYTYNDIEGFEFYGAQNSAIATPDLFLIPELDNFTITGDINNDSQYILDVSATDIALIAIGDIVSGTQFDSGTIIEVLGPDYIYLNQPATATAEDASITVSGSRIYLDANKVVASGSIEARHLISSAISSKAVADNNEKISDINLDEGTQIFRKQDGTIVWDFDPERDNDELRFSGNITQTAVGSDGNSVPTQTDLDDIGNIVKDQADGNILITISDTAPASPDTGDLWQNTSVSPAVLNSWDGSAWVTASMAEEIAFNLAEASNTLVDTKGKIFGPTALGDVSTGPNDYQIDDIWIRNIPDTSPVITAQWHATAANETYDSDDWEKVDNSIDITDGDSRIIKIGSEGVLVRDSANNIIHDLPDAPNTSAITSMGHFYFTEGLTAVATSSFAQVSVLANAGAWSTSRTNTVTFTANTYSNTNVKGVVVKVEIPDIGAYTPTSGGANFDGNPIVSLTSTAKIASVDWATWENQTALLLYRAITVPFTYEGHIENSFVILPLNSSNQAQIDITFYVAGITSHNWAVVEACTASVYQVGFYV